MALFKRDFPVATRLAVRIYGRNHDVPHRDIVTVLDGIRDADEFGRICHLYETESGKQLPTSPPAEGAVGDFFRWLLEWLGSPEGQGFIKFILALFGIVIP